MKALRKLRKTIIPKVFLILLFLICCLVGYMTFRYYYNVSGQFPFTQEFILVLVGVISTVLVTAILLIQQSNLDLRKEEKVILLAQKKTIYMSIIEKVAKMVDKRVIDKRGISEIRIINHKLSMFGSIPVVDNFNNILDLMLDSLRNGVLSEEQAEEIMHSIARLTFDMRVDLLGEIEGGDTSEVLDSIISNSIDIEQADDEV
ncbi:MAG: hypothetical protein CME62_00810 [Halobacteriovoraceae bacterium]|nr:hypothetical protein [Halobacteriovoraceae bacterium]|tara:strand:+ start:125 stop:733 length:609 start_codon:yes stop_codon:yes gene_type:complete